MEYQYGYFLHLLYQPRKKSVLALVGASFRAGISINIIICGGDLTDVATCRLWRKSFRLTDGTVLSEGVFL
ncbi:hypothetical protein PsorP6_000161 [Peronosclerospora sorghi]|uniref:Uncharacterized protein n=1 Tax=Peronosclerospora sorghi TaxID=230839 RepID=A0ACC0WVJ1_9STRA|nr:hypothetical protein PsorP6_000161 [Peronosclerospora sorghi]